MQQVILFESEDAIQTAARELDNGNFDSARKTLEENTQYIKDGKETYGSSPELDKVSTVNSDYQEEAKDFEKRDASEQKYIQKNNKMRGYDLRKKK